MELELLQTISRSLYAYI